MSWLPAVWSAGGRTWLPLSRRAGDIVTAVLARVPNSPDAKTVDAIAEQLRYDPPLAIFSATLARGSLTRQALAVALVKQLPPAIASGDAFLGMPLDRQIFMSRWNELHDSFMETPVRDWTRRAAEWFGVTAPNFPPLATDSMATIDDDSPAPPDRDDPRRYDETFTDFPLLARRMRRLQSLSDRFSQSLGDVKRGAVKQFAYGLSHEINNPLANISARAQTLMRSHDDEGLRRNLQKIIDQSMRAHEMVADLMFYAHPPSPVITSFDLTRVAMELRQQFTESVEGRNIEIAVACPDIVVDVLADRSMMLEAMRALVRNSVEAIGCDGQIEIACQIRGSATPGGNMNFVEVTVADSGPGLSEAARIHAFDPYFSGREAGRGLGVGLCRVERIATLHGGRVSLSSGLVGCVAKLWFPAPASP